METDKKKNIYIYIYRLIQKNQTSKRVLHYVFGEMTMAVPIPVEKN